MTEPRTKAGRTLFSRLWAVNEYSQASRIIAGVAGDILAIEAEATAAAEQRLRAELLRLHHRHTGKGGTGICDECLHTWPCATSRLLDSDTPAPREPEYPQPGCSCEPCQRAASPRQGEPHPECVTAYHAELTRTGQTIMRLATVQRDVADAEAYRALAKAER